ncbi:MAG: outer membrane lipoprotein carrier protein LolA [Myxococcaceae bacterium]|jgi:outer membrane lipoprotein carrier protein|nr:outer membrane lipoprotein carrier protein LolA [Myxococcaceae bacterium]
MLTRLLVTMLVSQVPEGNPIAQSVKKAQATRDAGVKATVVKPDGGTSADAGVSVDAGVAVVVKPVMAPEVKTLVDRMQAFYESTQDFTADFRQDYFYKLSKRTQTSTGTVVFAKPGLMRWEYLKPSLRTFVLAGVKVYMHDPEAKLLTVASLGTSKLSASVTFLFGQGKLADEFAITQKACEKCTGTLLQLDPLVPDPRFTRIFLEVDPKTAQVLKSTVVDPDGSENAIAFLNLKTNTLAAFDGGAGSVDPRFKLTPPPGTQVQDFTMGVGAQPKP